MVKDTVKIWENVWQIKDLLKQKKKKIKEYLI